MAVRIDASGGGVAWAPQRLEREHAVGHRVERIAGPGLGTLGGLFGIGGGLIAIPVLGVLFGLDQQLAQGTALVMVVPNVLLAIWRYHQRNRIDWRHAAALAGASFVFAIVGAAVAVSLDAGRMRLPSSAFSALAATRCCACFCARRPEMVSCVIPGHGSACSVRGPGRRAGCSAWAVR